MKNKIIFLLLFLYCFTILNAQSLYHQAITIGSEPCFGITVHYQNINNNTPIILHSGYNNWEMLENGAIVLKGNPKYGLTVLNQKIKNGSKIILHEGYNLWKVEDNGSIVLKDNPTFGLTILNQKIQDGTQIILHEGFNYWSTRQSTPCTLSNEELLRRWSTFELTYQIRNSPSKSRNISFNNETLIDLAFQQWQKHSQFTFRKVGKNVAADIIVDFVSGSDPIFKNSGKLAIGSQTGRRNNPATSGRIAFNNDIFWSDTDVVLPQQFDGTYNLRAVTLHELGHVLGLDHNPNSTSIMFDSYQNIWSLDPLTIGKIYNLYAN